MGGKTGRNYNGTFVIASELPIGWRADNTGLYLAPLLQRGGDAKQNCGPKYIAELLDYSTRPASQVFKKNWNGEGGGRN
jgi:hypothetical protein